MRRVAGAAAILFVFTWFCIASAQQLPPQPSDAGAGGVADGGLADVGLADGEVDAKTRGREAFLRGVALTNDEKWADALVAFREAAAAKDHPVVQHNIAWCERALGHYAAALVARRLELREPEGLTANQLEEARTDLAIEKKTVARIEVTLEPATAELTVDGLPLVFEEDPAAYRVSFDPLPRAPMRQSSFALLLDPGTHVFHASRPGHEDVEVERSFTPGEQSALDLRLDLLPATVTIRSEPAPSVVSIDGREVGLSPIEIQRPAGSYHVEIVRDHFQKYGATLSLQPGQRVTMTAKLTPESDALTRKWWFWTAAVAVVAGGAILTYAITRPAPQAPPYDGGSVNWVVHTQGVAW